MNPIEGHDGRPRPDEGDPGAASLTDLVCGIVEHRTPRWWWPAFLFSAAVGVVGLAMVAYLIATGIGVWGVNQPVGWGFAITNFVFWIGIGHAGTLISAVLFLLRQGWRTSINRAAEAMTIFAVICAGLFPTIHVGRVWFIWFFVPAPNSNAIWPNFRSPLMWDFAAVSTYFTVSLLFWYIGMVPDLASLRDRASSQLRGRIYGVLALGWRGSARHWRHYEMAYLLLAGLATPLVVSVHSIVSMDFAMAILPGWHSTIFPPYFVAGAIFSGFAMVITLLVPARQLFGLKDVITQGHLENMAKVLLATGLLVGYAYATEAFIALYSSNPYERFVAMNRAFGPYGWAYWTTVVCNVICPQAIWFRGVRARPWALFVVSVLVNVGMWMERFVIVVVSLHRDFLPSSWGMFVPTWVDVLQFVGSIGLFLTMFLLFLRFLPMVALSEIKGVLHVSGSLHPGRRAFHGGNGDGEEARERSAEVPA